MAWDRMESDWFATNLECLKRIYPGVEPLLRSTIPTLYLPQCATSPVTPSGCYCDPQADLHVVDRFAGSGLAFPLFERIQQWDLLERRGRRLLLIEDRPDWLRAEFSRADWRPLIQSENCLFIFDFPQGNELQRFLERYPEIAYAETAFYPGDTGAAPDRGLKLSTLFQLCREGIARYIETICREQQGIKSPPFPRTIRFPVAGHNYLQDACVQAFQRLGYGAERWQWKNPLYRFVRSAAWIHEWKTAPVDLLFFLNATPATFTGGSDIHRLPWGKIVWFVDNPRRYVFRPSDLAGCDVIGVFDRAYIPYLQTLTHAPVIEVPTAYGIVPGQGKVNPEFSKIDIAFVGELGARGFIPLERMLAEWQPKWLAAAGAVLRSADMTQPVDLASLAQEHFAPAGVDYQGALVDYLENKATALRRRYYLEALSGMGLRIFGGNEWADPAHAGPLAARYAGRRLEYTSELPALYASAKININIFHVQCVTAPNPRVYDVLAAGGFLLTTANSGLENEFVDGRDLVIFRSREELREKAAYYLAHPQERRAIAESGREHTLASHGYHDRMQRFLYALGSKAGEPHVYICR
ncbi:MAG TPA: glycosyltransferase [bacterium]|nr:glycosyltransferase [bacterium]